VVINSDIDLVEVGVVVCLIFGEVCCSWWGKGSSGDGVGESVCADGLPNRTFPQEHNTPSRN
jgi:hypothetical protein